MALCSNVWSAMRRKKTLKEDVMKSPLRRCLTTCDITLIGIGHMVGAAVYVVSGTIIKELAGPAAFLSSLIASVCALLAALCYAEFGAKVPKAGSAYTYTYICMGECIAFIIGWNTILENMIVVASVSKAWSATLTLLVGNVFEVPCFTQHICPDVTAFFVILVLCVIIAMGVRASININNVFAVVNLCILSLIIVASFVLGDASNMNPPEGGFAPYGVSGILVGSATCLFSYLGFEAMSVAAEEAKDPSRSLPRATLFTMCIVTTVYVLAMAGLAYLQPYYSINIATPYPSAFTDHGSSWLTTLVTIGTLIGSSCTMLGGMFNLPRSVYAIASDGLLFRFLANVHPLTQTPLFAIAIFGTITAFAACFTSLESLIHLLSVGTLMNFFMVSACVLLLRYQTVDEVKFPLKLSLFATDDKELHYTNTNLVYSSIGHLKVKCHFMGPFLGDKAPFYAVSTLIGTLLVFSATLQYGDGARAYLTLGVTGCLSVLCLIVLLMHVKNTYFADYQMPGVPFLPALSMLLDAVLLFQLNTLALLRLIIWVFVGLTVYLCYGIRKSDENRGNLETEQEPLLPDQQTQNNTISYSDLELRSTAVVKPQISSTR